jgi:DNA-binding NtrC family response regulator
MRRANARVVPSRYRILALSADEHMRRGLQAHLAPHYDTVLATSFEELSPSMKMEGWDAAFVDLAYTRDHTDGVFETLSTLRSELANVVLLAFMRSHNKDLRAKIMDAGIDECLVAPADFHEIQIVLGQALERRDAQSEYHIRQDEEPKTQSCGELIGGSESMLRLYEAIRRVAYSYSTVLLRGESGTGKELAARAIVSLGPRSDKPFISINCAALPEHLIETELFGHEKGAFTDAKEARPGYIELAHNGTLFLDEIATLGLALQSKLLRVLEERMVARIGGKVSKKIDFRLIAATNEDLEKLLQTGRFREDLYYRINVIPIAVPPLRERDGDLPLLVDHFLRQFCRANRTALKRIDAEVMGVLEDYRWPGNVRELQNVIQRLVLMSDGPVIGLKHVPQQLLVASSASQEAILIPEGGVDFDAEMERLEMAYLTTALNRTGGRKSAAAALLRIDAQRMKYLCRKRGL